MFENWKWGWRGETDLQTEKIQLEFTNSTGSWETLRTNFSLVYFTDRSWLETHTCRARYFLMKLDAPSQAGWDAVAGSEDQQKSSLIIGFTGTTLILIQIFLLQIKISFNQFIMHTYTIYSQMFFCHCFFVWLEDLNPSEPPELAQFQGFQFIQNIFYLLMVLALCRPVRFYTKLLL